MALWPPPRCPGADELLFRLLAEDLAEDCRAPTLDFLEIFAGHGAVHRALLALGYHGRAMDLNYTKSHDVLTPVGLLCLLRTVLDLRPGAILWAAPPCSSWVFLSRSSTGRDQHALGDFGSRAVVAQNALAERLVLALEMATVRGAWWIIEQPQSSCLWRYPAMQGMMKRQGLQPWTLDMGAFGGTSQKPTHLVGTAPYLARLARRCSPEEKLRLRIEGVQTTTRWLDPDGKKRCQGTAELKGTQAYPEGWGAAHALAFHSCQGPSACGLSSASGASSRAAELREVLQQLPPELREATSGAWWLRDFLGEPF